eukprot:3810304-Pyramimonas_sp.AAC.2
MCDFAQVRQCAAVVKARKAPLDVLVGNAGIFAMSAPREETKDGFEAHFGCNYLAHFLLTLLLLPDLLHSNRGTHLRPTPATRRTTRALRVHLAGSGGRMCTFASGARLGARPAESAEAVKGGGR